MAQTTITYIDLTVLVRFVNVFRKSSHPTNPRHEISQQLLHTRSYLLYCRVCIRDYLGKDRILRAVNKGRVKTMFAVTCSITVQSVWYTWQVAWCHCVYTW